MESIGIILNIGVCSLCILWYLDNILKELKISNNHTRQLLGYPPIDIDKDENYPSISKYKKNILKKVQNSETFLKQ
jgi:hypothetical protein